MNATDQAPRRVGKYILYERLGAGSMGRVYRARILGIGGVVKDVCLKQIHADRLARPGALDAFVHEARMWMRLAHANIVPVFDFGRSGDEYYLAMEWVDGVDLGALLTHARRSQNPLSPDLAAHVAAEVARALDYAHRMTASAIVHRDVKPANILVSRAGDVRLSDFGVAAVEGDRRGPAGTIAYMAPEQRSRGAVDPRCDVYSLGLVLGEMLTGVSPAEAGQHAGRLVPDELAPLLRAMGDEQLAHRPTAREVADALEEYVARARASGGTAPRDRISRRVRAIRGTRGGSQLGPPSAELAPELSFLHDGDDPSFVTQMTGAGVSAPASDLITSPTVDRPAAPERDDADAHAGDSRIGRYQLCFELASGGMAGVFLARAEGPAGFEKLVALKRIHPHLANEPEFIEMFLDEARIASRINHPNVCSMFDFGRANGTYFIAMEYVMGETFSAVLSRLARNPELLHDPRWPLFAARMIADACEGLHAAHELRGDRGEPLSLIHRDVSPQNLFVGYDGTVTIVDFGIARAAGRIHHTRLGRMKGKLAYVAPEQGRRKIELDRRADIWSLGVVLWELLVARNLFRRDSKAETVAAVLTGEIPPPSRIRQDVPQALDRIVLRALSRERSERFATAREMGRELNRWIARAGEPVTAADIAEWMEAHFSEEKARREEILEQSRRSGNAGVPRVSARLGGGSESSDDALPDVPTIEDRAMPWAQGEKTFARRVRRGIGRTTLLVLAAAAIAVGGAIGWVTSGEDAAPARRTETEPPRAVTTPPPAPAEPAQPEPEIVPVEPDPEDEADVVAEETDRRREPRAPPSRSRPGTLSVATPGGWADLYIGNRNVGRAPGEVRLRPGRYLVRLRPFGRGPERRRRVRVPPGGRVRVVVPVTDSRPPP